MSTLKQTVEQFSRKFKGFTSPSGGITMHARAGRPHRSCRRNGGNVICLVNHARRQDAITHFDDVTEGRRCRCSPCKGVLPAHRSIQLDSPRETFPPNLVNRTFPCPFLLDVAGQEKSSLTFDSKMMGGVELESNRSRGAVTLRIKSSKPQASLGNIDDIAKHPGRTSRRCKSAETSAPSGSRDAVTLRIVEMDLSTIETLQAPTYCAVYLQKSTGQNHIAVFGKIKALAELWVPQHIVIDATVVRAISRVSVDLLSKSRTSAISAT